MNPVGIVLLMTAAFAGFGYLAWRKLAIVASLQPEIRWDDPLGRLRRLLGDGLFQRRMVRLDPVPGVMHAVIFLGFLALLARKLQLIAIGFDEDVAVPGLLGGAFAFGKDVVEIAVLAAVVVAFYRRFVVRPRRLEANREAVLILVLIAVIMVTDLLFDGFRFALLADGNPAIAHERDFAFAGSALASLLSAVPRSAAQVGYQLSYWAQMLTVFTFLVLLPVGEHFHIVTALPTLFFGRPAPLNRVPSVDLDRVMNAADGEEVSVGVRTARDLSWKDGLDAFTCTECGRCKDACPTFLTGKPLALKWVNDSLKRHLVEQRPALVGKRADVAVAAGPTGSATASAGSAQSVGEPADGLPPLVGGVIGEDTLWACTTCGYCETACPIGLEHLGKFFRMRQQRVLMEGEFPHELKAVFDAYEVQSNPWAYPADTRGDWARGLNVPVIESAEQLAGMEWLFYVGSAESFDPRGQKIARAFVEILRAAGVRFAILGARETSTGECVRRAGNEMLFQTLAQQLVGTLGEVGATKIVTCDPHAFNSLRNEYPEFGGHFEVVHHTQLIAQLLAQRRIALTPAFERVILHDPCYLGRHNGEYAAPRALVAAVSRDRPLEFALSREKAMCCGAGGGRMWMEETIGKRINLERVEQALPLRPTLIATACPYCAVMIADGLGAAGRDGDIKTRDVAELVAAALVRVEASPAAAPPA